jgi:hypothetical protein
MQASCRAADEAECAKYCKKTEGCSCSYFSPASSACSLMTAEGGACLNDPYDPNALAYVPQAALRNQITVQCGGFDFVDPSYNSDY